MADIKESLPEAIDLSHHVNTKSKSRHPSPLKDIIKYMGVDGMISLAGGELIVAYAHTNVWNQS